MEWPWPWSAGLGFGLEWSGLVNITARGLLQDSECCLSVTRVNQSKTVQATITKSSPSAAWKTSFRNRKAFP